MLFCLPAQAQEWSKADKALFATSSVLLATDWAQTRYIAKHSDIYHENNVLLGKHPAVGTVNAYFAGTLVANYLLMDYLSPENRKYFQYVLIGVEGTAVAHNAHIGIKLDF